VLDLRMEPSCADGLRSGCQIARRVTEGWAAENLYCACCDSDTIRPTRPNSQAVDFTCPNCSAGFQLKSGRNWNERRIPDAGYEAMLRALRSDAVPNLLVMQYTSDWRVKNLLLVPCFFFSEAAVEKRKPLGPCARRAGWIGCNILLSEIADVGKIRIVESGQSAKANEVRRQYDRIRPLAAIQATARGWTLDVLRLIRGLGKREFVIAQAYGLEGELSALYPKNRNVRPKIRQQLQVLRDLGFLKFLGNGRYKLTS
jgi:type II restriction enzyme